VEISGRTRLFAVLGDPIAQAKAPVQRRPQGPDDLVDQLGRLAGLVVR
jgi:hypothetical protein